MTTSPCVAICGNPATSCHHPKKTVLKFTSHGFDLGANRANPGDFEKGIRLRNHPRLWWFEGFNAPCSVHGVSMVLSIFLQHALSCRCINHLPSVHNVHLLDVMTRCFTCTKNKIHKKKQHVFLYVHAKNIPCLQRFFSVV